MYKYFNKQKNLNRGFSLVEMLVAVAVFMSIMTVALSTLVTTIDANRKAQAIKSTIDSVTFAIESMSKEMRMGTEYKCSLNGSFPVTLADCANNGGVAVKFKTNGGSYIIYKFDGGTLKKCTDDNCLTPEDLISKDSGVSINNMTFYVVGANNELNSNVLLKTQPRVVITISGTISVKSSITNFDLQTSVSQRIRNS